MIAWSIGVYTYVIGAVLYSFSAASCQWRRGQRAGTSNVEHLHQVFRCCIRRPWRRRRRRSFKFWLHDSKLRLTEYEFCQLIAENSTIHARIYIYLICVVLINDLTFHFSQIDWVFELDFTYAPILLWEREGERVKETI